VGIHIANATWCADGVLCPCSESHHSGRSGGSRGYSSHQCTAVAHRCRQGCPQLCGSSNKPNKGPDGFNVPGSQCLWVLSWKRWCAVLPATRASRVTMSTPFRSAEKTDGAQLV